MKRINADERMVIQAYLIKGCSISEIAKQLKRHKSTISREISRHITIIKTNNKNSFCPEKRFICNGCKKRYGCQCSKRFYDFDQAHKQATHDKVVSRRKSKLTPKEIEIIDKILIEQIRELKQSLHHVYVVNPILQKICSERTIRRSIYKGVFSVKAHELRKYVVFKHEYIKKPNFQLKDISILIGRNYSSFIEYINKHKSKNIVQYDSVVGKISDRKAILTISFPKYGFQFGVLIKKSNPHSVVKSILEIFAKIGKEKSKEIFPINLSDNGIEFSYFNKIEEFENEKICRTFFTNPYKATDKPHCERYHEFIRYFIPKGKSLDFLTQERVNWMFSQINSYVRKSKNDRTPYELVERRFGKAFLDAIGIFKVQKKKVSMTQIC